MLNNGMQRVNRALVSFEGVEVGIKIERKRGCFVHFVVVLPKFLHFSFSLHYSSKNGNSRVFLSVFEISHAFADHYLSSTFRGRPKLLAFWSFY